MLLLFIRLSETNYGTERKEILTSIEAKISDTQGYITKKLVNVKDYIEGKRLDENSIEILNSAEPDPQHSGWYNWEVFLKVPDKGLSLIDNVEYILHRTFGCSSRSYR